VLTGHLLKDPEAIRSERPVVEIEGTIEELGPIVQGRA
jgi:hypothetical protein